MGTFRLSVTSIIFLSTFSNKIGLKTAFCVKGFHSSQHSFCSIVSPSITHCLVGHLSGWFSSVPSFFFFLFWVEGCKHIWYRFGAVRYDSYWLNWPIVKHITYHQEDFHPFWLDKCMTDLITLWQGWHLCRSFYLSFPYLVLSLSHQSSAIELFYWDWSIDHCSD